LVCTHFFSLLFHYRAIIGKTRLPFAAWGWAMLIYAAALFSFP
jgi:hypothetical protein